MLLVRKSSVNQIKRWTNRTYRPTEQKRLILKLLSTAGIHLLASIFLRFPNWILWVSPPMSLESARMVMKESRKMADKEIPRLKLWRRLKNVVVPFLSSIMWPVTTWRRFKNEIAILSPIEWGYWITPGDNRYPLTWFHMYRHSLVQPIFVQIVRLASQVHVSLLRLEPFKQLARQFVIYQSHKTCQIFSNLTFPVFRWIGLSSLAFVQVRHALQLERPAILSDPARLCSMNIVHNMFLN